MKIATNAPTLYELAIERTGEARELVCYTSRKARQSIVSALYRDNIMSRYEGVGIERAGKAADGIRLTDNTGATLARLFFTGRTQRDARAMGALPYLEAIPAAVAVAS